eukprot:1136633-Pelagomonas_calceolata.AAC.3
MLLHKKHDPLDVLLHQTLGYVMLATALSIWAEVVWPQSFTATLCRVGTVMGQKRWGRWWGGSVHASTVGQISACFHSEADQCVLPRWGRSVHASTEPGTKGIASVLKCARLHGMPWLYPWRTLND